MSGVNRDALRLACRCDGKGDHHPITPDEFDALARAWAVENGWVEPEEELDETP